MIHGKNSNNSQYRFYQYIIFRRACAITDDTTVIITGGWYTPSTASRYGTTGHIEDLPFLNQGRAKHGCGAYTDDSGEQVIVITYSILISLTTSTKFVQRCVRL